jgi:hypothetical protein
MIHLHVKKHFPSYGSMRVFLLPSCTTVVAITPFSSVVWIRLGTREIANSTDAGSARRFASPASDNAGKQAGRHEYSLTELVRERDISSIQAIEYEEQQSRWLIRLLNRKQSMGRRLGNSIILFEPARLLCSFHVSDGKVIWRHITGSCQVSRPGSMQRASGVRPQRRMRG